MTRPTSRTTSRITSHTTSQGTSRRTLLKRSLLIGAAMLGSSLSLTASALETIKVRLDYVPHGMQAPFYLALEKGFFTEQGLQVEIEDGNGTNTTLALVAAGKYDIGHAVLAALPVARDKGMPVKAIAAVVRKGDLGIVVGDGSGIQKPKDLEGKTILYSTASVETPFIDTYLRKAGVDKSKVNLMNVDASVKISTYMSGKGDGAFTPVPMYTLKGISPRQSTGLLFADAGINLPGFGLVTSEDTIAHKPKELAGFVAAYQRAWEGIASGKLTDEAVAAMIKNRPQAKLDPKVIKAQLESGIPYLNSDATKGQPLLWMAPADWKAAAAVMADLNLIKPSTNPETLYTNQFVPAKK